MALGEWLKSADPEGFEGLMIRLAQLAMLKEHRRFLERAFDDVSEEKRLAVS